MEDYYKILGVPRSASPDDIRKAYRELGKQYHPDIPGGSDEKFKPIRDAYEILSDSDAKARYDRFGTTTPSPEGGRRKGPIERQFDEDLAYLTKDPMGFGTKTQPTTEQDKSQPANETYQNTPNNSFSENRNYTPPESKPITGYKPGYQIQESRVEEHGFAQQMKPMNPGNREGGSKA